MKNFKLGFIKGLVEGFFHCLGITVFVICAVIYFKVECTQDINESYSCSTNK